MLSNSIYISRQTLYPGLDTERYLIYLLGLYKDYTELDSAVFLCISPVILQLGEEL